MSNELFIGLGVMSSATVVTAFGVGLFAKRDSQVYVTAWFVCFGVILFLVAIYTWIAFAAFNEEPRKGGSRNPGGPSGYIIENLLVMAAAMIAAPASYICLLLLSLLPPKLHNESARRRIRIYGCSIAVAAAIISLACLNGLSRDIRKERDKSKERRINLFSASTMNHDIVGGLTT